MEASNIRDILTSFSPSLDFLAISSGDGRIKIWDTLKGQVQTEFADIASTEETNLLARAEGGHLSVDYTCMKWLSLEKKKKRKLGSSLLVLGTGSGDVLALDVSAGQLKWRVSDCHPGGVTAISFPTNGSCIYTAGADGIICNLDSLTGNLLSKFKASTKGISSMSVSPDGKTLATAAAQLKLFTCSDQKKLQKFSGHPAAVRCIIFSEDGKHVISSAVGERYVAVWKIDGSKNKAALCVLAMDHPAVFLDSKCIVSEDGVKSGLSVLAISETGVGYFWCVNDIEELCNSKATKVLLSIEDGLSKTPKGAVPTIFAAKLQGIVKPVSGNLLLAYGLPVKPSFEKVLLKLGADIKLISSLDGILLPVSQSRRSKKGLNTQTHITALDRANAEGALLPITKMFNLADGESGAKPAIGEDDMAVDEVTMCMEDRLRTQGILSNDDNQTSNLTLISKLLKGFNLEVDVPQKKMRVAVLSMGPSEAYKLLQVLLTMWQSRTSSAKYVLPWIHCILVNHGDYARCQEPGIQLLDSIYKYSYARSHHLDINKPDSALTKSKGDALHSLLQLSGRLQLVTAQIDKGANKSKTFEHDKQLGESEDEDDDEDVEEVLYGEESEESQNTSDEDD